MAALFADEDFPYPTVHHLRSMGHSIITAREAGLASRADADILAAAMSGRRAVVTHNRRHFLRLHRQVPGHSGIIICTKDEDFLALAQRIDAAIRNREPLAGKLVRVNQPG